MKISVYITSYNQKDYLKEAIESVLNQTLTPFEIIIVDDCSTDGSQNLIKEYSKKYDLINYIFHSKNKGVSAVRITALNNIKGDFVTYLDGDDIYLSNKLEVESKIIKKLNCDLVFSNNMYVNPDDLNDVKWIWANNAFKIKKDTNLFVKTLTRDFPRKSLFRMELVRYSVLQKIGFHDTNLKIYEDYDLRIRLSQIAKFGYTLEPTTKIRISKNGLSKTNIKEHYNSFEYIFNKYKGDIEELDFKTRVKVEAILNEFLNTFKNKTKEVKKISFINKLKKWVNK